MCGSGRATSVGKRPAKGNGHGGVDGFFKLYVNEFVVGTCAYYPLRDDGTARPRP
jgi:hypothetical protein